MLILYKYFFIYFQWIYDILDHKIGQEKIILEDLDSVLGFVLLPHLQWDQKDVEELHLVAVVRPRGIKSLRDLTANHIPLLKNIDSKVSVSYSLLYVLKPFFYLPQNVECTLL